MSSTDGVSQRVPRARIPSSITVLLGALAALGPLATDMYLPGLPGMAADLGVSTSIAQLTLSGFLIGMACGQLVAGPLSDARGRRRPLLLGLFAYCVSTILCALAPSAAILIAFRFVQGVSAAFGIAIGRAVVRDVVAGREAARIFALTMLVMSLGPIVAPTAGALILGFTTWRGIFGFLALLGAALLATVAIALPETHPTGSRTSGAQAPFKAFLGLLGDRDYLAYTVVLALCTGALLSYISGSPFALEHVYDLSPQIFALLFAANGASMVLAQRLCAALVHRLGPRRILGAALTVQGAGTVGVLVCVTVGLGLLPLMSCLFLAVGAIGVTIPMATALALENQGGRTGSASGGLGFTQFVVAAGVSPLVGLAGPVALPMAVMMLLCAAGAGLAFRAAD